MKQRIVPALGSTILTPLYDTVVRATTREKFFKSKLLNCAGLVPSEKILDVGCGTGTLLRMMRELQPSLKSTGLDADPAQLNVAREKLGAEVELIEGYSTDLPFEKESFDCVLSSLFFHHINREAKRKSLAEIFRVLKQNGRCLIADWGKAKSPLMRTLFYQIQFLDGFENTADNVDGRIPDLMSDSGFSDCREIDNVSTIFGTISLYEARKAGKQ